MRADTASERILETAPADVGRGVNEQRNVEGSAQKPRCRLRFVGGGTG